MIFSLDNQSSIAFAKLLVNNKDNNKTALDILKEMTPEIKNKENLTKISAEFDEFSDVKKKYDKFTDKYANFSISSIDNLFTIEKQITKLTKIFNDEKIRLIKSIEPETFSDYVRININMGKIVRDIMIIYGNVHFSGEITNINDQLEKCEDEYTTINIPSVVIYDLQKKLSD
jgi:hypothetical protein